MVMKNDVIIKETRLLLKPKLSLLLFLCKMSLQTSTLIEAKCLRTTCTRLAIKILSCLNKLPLHMASEACRARYWPIEFYIFTQQSGIYKLSWHSKTQWKVQLPHSNPLPTLHPTIPSTLHSQWCFDWLSVRARVQWKLPSLESDCCRSRKIRLFIESG